MYAIPPNSRKADLIDLVVNSRYREDYNTTTSSDFWITLSNPIPGQITRYRFKTACIPKTGYNVGGSFQITDSVSIKTVTILPGNYTAQTLAVELETQLNALGVDTYTVTLIENKYTITSTFATFILNPNNLANNLLYIIGFGGNIAYTAVGGVLTSYGGINLSLPDYLYITFSPLKKHIKNITGQTHNFVVNFGCNYGDVIYHNSDSYTQDFPPYNFVSDLNLARFRVMLKYEDGTLYDLNGSDWTFIVEMETVQNYSYQS